MIIKQSVVDAINAQIQSEFGASQQYIAIAVYFDEESLPDLAAFFYRQSEEERAHAMKFVQFLLETGAKPIIPNLPEMKNEFSSATEAVQYALDQEIKVTNQINNIMRIATEENDFASQNFLQWFVEEQVEEVDSMTSLLQTIKHAGSALLLVEDYVRRSMAATAAGVGEA
jgi:bacterioferritin B